MKSFRFASFLGVALSLFASCAMAQATRTWVSGVGDDINPCSRTAPCKTFAGAISKTAAGGEINVMDPGAYGTLTITKSITVSGEGTFAGVLASSINGFVVNAGANDVVIIRGVNINGAGGGGITGLNGIRFLAGRELHVENVHIYGFLQQGIDFAPSGSSSLFVSNTSIRNTGGAVWIHPGGAGTALATLNRVTMDGNGRGLRVEEGSIVVARDSQATGNDSDGFAAFSSSRVADITTENCVSSNNLGSGVFAFGSLSTVSMSNTLITRNASGIAADAGGIIVSFGNNRVRGNNSNNGPPSATPGQM